MVAIVLHLGSDETVQVNADRIMYSIPGQGDGGKTRVYMDEEQYALDVLESPKDIAKIVEAAEQRVHSPDSRKVRDRDIQALRDSFKGEKGKRPDGRESPAHPAIPEPGK